MYFYIYNVSLKIDMLDTQLFIKSMHFVTEKRTSKQCFSCWQVIPIQSSVTFIIGQLEMTVWMLCYLNYCLFFVNILIILYFVFTLTNEEPVSGNSSYENASEKSGLHTFEINKEEKSWAIPWLSIFTLLYYFVNFVKTYLVYAYNERI